MGSNIVANPTSALRVGQFSAFMGDRPDGMEQLLRTGVDILVGDYLAELTMLVLHKNQQRGGTGYAQPFVDQLVRNLPAIAASGTKVVTNAGGLDPVGCADEVRRACDELGLDLRIASITGDDLREALPTIFGADTPATNIDTGQVLELDRHEVLTAHAYLGAWPIVAALDAGADIVICPRMTDASLLVGPAAWHFGWKVEDWDELAGAVVAAHLIECGSQVTGGNYSLFDQHDDLGIPGWPIAHMHPDGSCEISKTTGSGGVVNLDTVKSQLFYEVGGREYQNPDVITDLTSISLHDHGGDVVGVSGVRGRAPGDQTKLSLTYEGGYRNTLAIGITGGNVESKVAWLKRQMITMIGPPADFEAFRCELIGPASTSDGSQADSTALLVVSARDHDRSKVSRAAFADPIVHIGTASIPGFFMMNPPQRERLFAVQWPCLVDKRHIHTTVHIDGRAPIEVAWHSFPGAQVPPATIENEPPPVDATADTTRVTLSSIVATRSGDKGGMANLGVWARDPAAFAWLRDYLTVERLVALMPEIAGLRVERHVFANLDGVNFLLYGYLDHGVSSSLRVDAQAKGLGEYLGSRWIDAPVSVVESSRT